MSDDNNVKNDKKKKIDWEPPMLKCISLNTAWAACGNGTSPNTCGASGNGAPPDTCSGGQSASS